MRFIVGFSKKTHFFARAIMWFTKSQFSHCYIVKECDACESKNVLEANSHGVGMGPYPVFLKEKAIVIEEYVIDHDVEQLNQAWDVICLNRLHRPYSYMQILGDAIVIMLQAITGWSLPNPFSQRKKDVCSELVLGYIRRSKISGFEKLNAGTVSPEDLNKIIKGDEQFTLLE